MHVDFLSLTLDNAVCFKHAYMPLKDQGLVHIRGENLDEGGSNGSGKTSLFEMLFYLFYDRLTKSPRQVKKDELLNVYHPSNFVLHAEILREGVPYTVEKYRKVPKKYQKVKNKSSGVDLWRDGVHVTKDDPREAQKEIAGLLGRSWSETKGSIYLGQRHIHQMIDGTPSEKKLYMSRYFGLDSLDDMISTVDKRINAIPLPDETHLNSLLEGVLSDLEAIGDLSSLEEECESLVEKRDALQSKMINAKSKLSAQEEARDIQKEQKRWRKFLSSKFGLELDAEEVKEALEERRSLISSLSKDLRSVRSRTVILEEIEELGGVLDDGDPSSRLESLGDSLRDLERLLPSLEKRKRLEKKLSRTEEDDLPTKKLESRKEKWENRLAENSPELSVLSSELSRLYKVGDSCYTCLRPISPQEKEEMIADREQAKASLEKVCENAKSALSSYSERLEIAEERAALLLELEDLPDGDADEVSDQLEEVRKEHRRLKSLQSKFVRLSVLHDKLSDLPECEKSEEALASEAQEAKEEKDSLDDAYQWILQCGSVTFDVYAYQRLLSAIETYDSRLSATNESLFSLQESRAQAKALKKQEQEITKKLNTASREKTKSQALSYVQITLKELKKMGLRESTKLLTSVLPIYLEQLFPKGDIELAPTDNADGFDLVFNKGGKNLPLTLISGGQAKRVGLAIVFAFAKMGRNTSNLLICDEPFRDLDKNGREACFEVLRDFDMGTILVTSHDQDMNASKKYDQVWTVQMKNHVSTLYLDG